MNEEIEDEQNGLGGLPDDILDERGEMQYLRTKIPGAEGPASAVSARNAMHSRETTGKEESKRTGTTGTPRYKANVQSTFDVRPVNAVDKIFGGLIEMRVPTPAGPTTCDIVVDVSDVEPVAVDVVWQSMPWPNP